MSERVTLVMEPREKGGKGENRRLRKAGWTPCVFYGPEVAEPVMGKIASKSLEHLLARGRWEAMRLTVKLPSGAEEMCIIREAQRDPLTSRPVHIDLLRLVQGRKISVKVPVKVHGREASPGLKDGGVLESVHELEVESLPMSIPESILVDVSSLRLGESLHVRDLTVGEDVTLLADPDEVVAIVVVPRGVEESSLESEEPAEVEVVAKGKAAKAEEGVD